MPQTRFIRLSNRSFTARSPCRGAGSTGPGENKPLGRKSSWMTPTVGRDWHAYQFYRIYGCGSPYPAMRFQSGPRCRSLAANHRSRKTLNSLVYDICLLSQHHLGMYLLWDAERDLLCLARVLIEYQSLPFTLNFALVVSARYSSRFPPKSQVRHQLRPGLST
jgi:hypothetical protein